MSKTDMLNTRASKAEGILSFAVAFAVAAAMLAIGTASQQALATEATSPQTPVETTLEASAIDYACVSDTMDLETDLQAQGDSVAGDLMFSVTPTNSRYYAPDGGTVTFICSLTSNNFIGSQVVPTIAVSADTPRLIVHQDIDQQTQNELLTAANKRRSELQKAGIDVSQLFFSMPQQWAYSSNVYVDEGMNAQYAGRLRLEFEEGFNATYYPLTSLSLGDALGAIDLQNMTCERLTYLPSFNYCRYATEITLPETGQWVISEDFCKEAAIESLTIPNSIVRISRSSFKDCTHLHTVSFQENSILETIDGFAGCTNLNASAVLANLPQSVTAIGNSRSYGYSDINGAFRGCKFPDGMVIPEGVTSIGQDAFRGVTGLDGATVIVPASVATVYDSAFAFGDGQSTPPAATLVFENADLTFAQPSSSMSSTRGRAKIDDVVYENPFGNTAVNIRASAYSTTDEASLLSRFYADGSVWHGTSGEGDWVQASEARLSDGVIEFQFSSPISAVASFEASGNALSIPDANVTVGEPFTVKAYYQLDGNSTSGTVDFSVPNGLQVLSISDASQRLTTEQASAGVNANAGVLYVRMQASAPGVHMIDMCLNGGSEVATSFVNASGIYIEGSSQDRSAVRGMKLTVRSAPETQINVTVADGDTVTATTNKRGLTTVAFSAPESAASAGSVHVTVTAGEGQGTDTIEEDLPYTSSLQLHDFGFAHGSERVAFVEDGSHTGVRYYRSYSNEPTVDQADWTVFATIYSTEDSLNSAHVRINPDAMGVSEPDCSFDLELVQSGQSGGWFTYELTGNYQDLAYLHDALDYAETGRVALALYFAISSMEISIDTPSGETTLLGWFSLRGIMDPSGIVYEAVPSNTLSGVTATVYRSESMPEGAGDTTSGERWDAENYDQVNPQITGDDGSYAWDVPDGFYQVRFTKSGYRPAATDWMEVQPPRYGLWTELVSEALPTVQVARVKEGGIELTFSQYMKTGFDAVDASDKYSGIAVTINGETVPVSQLQWINCENNMDDEPLSRTLLVNAPENGEFSGTIALSVSDARNYTGNAMGTAFATELAMPDAHTLEPDIATVTVVGAGGGALAGGSVTGAGPYELGSIVTLTAVPDEGYTFKGWKANGNVELVSESDALEAAANLTPQAITAENDTFLSTDATIRFRANGDVTIQAIFAPIQTEPEQGTNPDAGTDSEKGTSTDAGTDSKTNTGGNATDNGSEKADGATSDSPSKEKDAANSGDKTETTEKGTGNNTSADTGSSSDTATKGASASPSSSSTTKSSATSGKSLPTTGDVALSLVAAAMVTLTLALATMLISGRRRNDSQLD